MELFKLMTGTQMVHVPFRDAQQAITGVIGGQVDLQFENTGAIVPHIRAGRVRALAVSGPRRSAAVPELPTVAEAGVAGFEVVTWSGLIGPSGIPKDIVARLNAELNKALATAAVKEKFAALGYEATGGTPEQFDALIRNETLRWGDVVKRVGARVD
jgi:tripartite-type tricarboxylate transporter receptor subunit TctC